VSIFLDPLVSLSQESHGEMKRIPHPLPAPTDAEIDLAKTDADARKRVRNQRLRVKRREEEIVRLTAENADVDVFGDGVDNGDDNDDIVDYDTDNYVDRYVCLSHECRDVLGRSIRTRSFVFAH
jgi:hypothetical protein